MKAVISVHCHNDLGLAVANSLSAVQNGARQVEVAVNGIGERAGNASLEEIVMALYVRHDLYGIGTQIDTTQLTRASRLVSKVTGMVVQPNKAIVGANAFAHEAGIHQDGMLKHEETYEIMRPETVGAGKTQLVLGKHSGRHAFANRLVELGYPVSGDGLDKAFARFKKLADKKKHITDADLVALVSDELYQPKEYWKPREDPGRLRHRHADRDGSAHGTRRVTLHTPPRSAPARSTRCTRPFSRSCTCPCTLLEYTVQSVTEGIDALGEVSVRVSPDDAQAPSPTSSTRSTSTRARGCFTATAHTPTSSSRAPKPTSRRSTASSPSKKQSKTTRQPEAPRRSIMEPKTLFQKVWDEHVVVQEPDRPAVLYIDLHLIHEVTSPQAFTGLRERGLGCAAPTRPSRRWTTRRRRIRRRSGSSTTRPRRQLAMLERQLQGVRHRALSARRQPKRHRARHRTGARVHAARQDHRVR